ncbi:MAG: pyridoxal phosphate-dependent aminotransferase family protein [Fimbriimonadaceae bacterium]
MTLGPQLRPAGKTRVVFEGRKLLFFAGTDYHRLSRHPELLAAAKEAMDDFGLTASGSRATTANHPLLGQLEQALTEFLGSESVLLTPNGYLAPTVLLQGNADRFAAAYLDERAHPALWDAAAASGLPAHPFPHADAGALADRVGKTLPPGGRPVVVTDAVFAALGDPAPVLELLEVSDRFGGQLVLDEAHAVAVLGPSGKGLAEHLGVPLHRVWRTGTLGKGFGAAGGFVAADAATVSDCVAKSRAFVGASPLALPIAAAALAGVRLLTRDRTLIESLQTKALGFKQVLREMGVDQVDLPMPIAALTLGDPERNRSLSDTLLEWGIYPPFIDYPGSLPGGQFRFAIASAHSDMEIDALVEALRDGLDRFA